MTNETHEKDNEHAALGSVLSSLQGLEPEAQARILNYIVDRFKIKLNSSREIESIPYSQEYKIEERRVETPPSEPDELDGVNSVAKKWIARNGFNPKELEAIFSIGGEEIDLIAKDVPGKNKATRMRSVFLLKGVAAYLGTGAARFNYPQVKEACSHYDAYDKTNFATYLKNMASEVSGNKEVGYTLTPKGLAAASEMLKTCF